MQSATTGKKIFMIVTAVIAWFAILLQFYLKTGSAANFFSFFTVECNLLIAISLTILLIASSSPIGKFFSTVSVQSAIALYIFIVSLVYNTVLRGLVPLSGWGSIVDNLLHVLVPILYIIYWIVFVQKGNLHWKNVIGWSLFPLLYLVYSLVRGSIVHWYPYPFLNADVLGYEKVSINSLGVLAVFVAGAFGMIALNRIKK